MDSSVEIHPLSLLLQKKSSSLIINPYYSVLTKVYKNEYVSKHILVNYAQVNSLDGCKTQNIQDLTSRVSLDGAYLGRNSEMTDKCCMILLLHFISQSPQSFGDQRFLCLTLCRIHKYQEVFLFPQHRKSMKQFSLAGKKHRELFNPHSEQKIIFCEVEGPDISWLLFLQLKYLFIA